MNTDNEQKAPVSFQLTTSLAEVMSFDPCESGAIAASLVAADSGLVDIPLTTAVQLLPAKHLNFICWLLGKRRTEISILVVFSRHCADSIAHLRGSAANANATAIANAAANAIANAADATAIADAAINATTAADAAVYAAMYAAAHDAARRTQQEKNKRFMLEAIAAYESEQHIKQCQQAVQKAQGEQA